MSIKQPSPNLRTFGAGLTLVGLFAVLVRYELPSTVMDYAATAQHVGPFQFGPEQRHFTPDNHVLTPVGIQVELQGMRPNALALSPDGRLLVAAGTTAVLVCVDPLNGKILQEVSLPPENQVAPSPVSGNILNPDGKAKLSFTGLVFSPDGTKIFLSNVNGSIKVFQVDEKHTVTPSFTIPLPAANAPKRRAEIPSGLAISKDGLRLYVALNLSNRVAEIDAASGKILRTWEVGVAPYDVALAGESLYVSNWGGRRPEAGDQAVGPAGQGMTVRIDASTTAAREGSISIIHLGAGGMDRELVTGRHASALAVHPSGKWVVCACAADDFVAVVDTAKEAIIEKIWPKKTPADLFGAAPGALTFDADGEKLYVCNSSQNAVAVVEFEAGESKLEGLIPTAWYPGSVAYDAARNRVHVANIKGLGSWRRIPTDLPTKFISGNHFGTLSLMDLPASAEELKQKTARVLINGRAPALQSALLPPRRNVAPKPVPERHGEPSVFKHVLYIIKENRTYDQVLGDMPEGNGDPSLCIFGEKITPNQHKLSRDFVLLDNTYCSGVLSADGHNWSCSAITTDYVERGFSGWPRSYPDGFEPGNADSLAWAPTGFIWDHAMKAGRKVRVYGEFCEGLANWKDPSKSGKPSWQDQWREFQAGSDAIQIRSVPTLATLGPINCDSFSGWDQTVSDVQRASVFLRELKQWEQSGEMPNLMIMSLSMDHTSGTQANYPTPAAQVADNDLAFARMVEAVSKSRFWKDTCIFAIQDDPQNGWDHVSAYRTTAYVASPYTKRGAVVSTQYNQTSLMRTMELMLGLEPMHELDAVATPMFDCFTEVPDFSPWQAVANQQALDEMNPSPTTMEDGPLKEDALVSAQLPLERPDACPEGVLNEILWRAMKGTSVPFPHWAAGVEEGEE